MKGKVKKIFKIPISEYAIDNIKNKNHTLTNKYKNLIKGRSGVYLFYTGQECIYVGKSKNLRKRIQTYISPNMWNWSEKIENINKELRKESAMIEVLECEHPYNYVVEQKLIKEKDPKYNSIYA